jgi:hypothetical protein
VYSPDRTVAARLSAQLLVPPGASDVVAAVERLLAIQAQDARAFRLAVRARTQGCSASDVDAAMTQRREILVSWLCRGTLHLVRSADYWWLHALTAPRLVNGIASRLAQLGVDQNTARRGVEAVVAAVSDGPRTRAQLRVVAGEVGVPTQGQALVHILAAASVHEHLVRGPVLDGEHCFVDARRWLSDFTIPDRDECLARLAGRYLAAHGPASPADLAAYAGITLRDARHAFALADSIERVGDDMYEPAARTARDPLPPPRLLGMFDPVLHGWADRSFVTGSHSDVVTSNGMFRAVALVEGAAAGIWTVPGGVVTLAPFRPLAAHVLAALEAEAHDVLRFLGLPQTPLRVDGGV